MLAGNKTLVRMRGQWLIGREEDAMQGKACFNFSVVDRALIDELARVTRRGYEGWRELGWVE